MDLKLGRELLIHLLGLVDLSAVLTPIVKISIDRSLVPC